ncbi:hypothetical protein ACLB2K_071647 [Fragaria x ananassa]
MATSSSSTVGLKLLIVTKQEKVLFAEAGKDFVDFLFTLLSLPLGTVVRLLDKDGMVGGFGKLYQSVKNLHDTYMQPNSNRVVLLKPKAPLGSNILKPQALGKRSTCVRVGKITKETSGTGGVGLVKGVVTYMIMDDLEVKPMSTISSITLLNRDVGALQEKAVDMFVAGLQLDHRVAELRHCSAVSSL